MSRKLRSLSDLAGDPKNANKGTTRGRKMVSDSLSRYGAGRSILTDKNGVVIAGNKTLEAARAEGREIVVIPTDGTKLVVVQRTDLELDSKKARGLAVADNRASELGLEWDADVLRALDLDLSEFFTESELYGLLGEEKLSAPEPKIDAAAELQKKWNTKRGQVWQCGNHRIMCGDSRSRKDVRTLLGDRRPDCIFTSPPYAVGVDYGEYKDTISNLKLLLVDVAGLWREIIKPHGYLVINFGDIASNREATETEEPCEYPMATVYWPIFRHEGWRLWTRRVWCKPNPRVHAPWSITTNRAATDFEHVWTWVLSGKPTDIRHGSVDRHGWFDTSRDAGVDVGKDVHGAGMALSCAVRMVRIHTEDKDLVFEPFTGTGTTIAACQNINRECFGMELSPRYLAVTIERLSDMGLKPKLVKHGKETPPQEQPAQSSEHDRHQEKEDAPRSRAKVHVEARPKRQSGRQAEEAHAHS